MDRDLPHVLTELAPFLGLSRPAAQCLGAIWRAARAPTADDLVTELGLSRSNVSVALKDLRGLGLIRPARAPGSRKDHFFADPDPWALLRQILAERQRRELAPLAGRLAAQSGTDPRVEAIGEVVAVASAWMERLARLEPAALAAFMVADVPRRKKKKKG